MIYVAEVGRPQWSHASLVKCSFSVLEKEEPVDLKQV